jgi:hypothetical protein
MERSLTVHNNLSDLNDADVIIDAWFATVVGETSGCPSTMFQHGSQPRNQENPDNCVEAPRVATDVEATIAGPIGRVRFTQRYVNPSNLWVNGSYGFEVPQEATVATMRAVVGDRAFESKIYTA